MQIENLADGYIKFLGKQLIETKEDNIHKFELPFPHPSGDSIILTVTEKQNGEMIISDNGFIDAYLFNYGIDLWKIKQKKIREDFKSLRERYNLILEEAPYLVIKSEKDNLYSRIYEMANLINELASFKLLAPSVQFKYFKQTVKFYFIDKKIDFKENPDTLEFKISENRFSIDLDFLIYKRKAYIKLISSKKKIRYWALNFIKIKEYYRSHNQDLELWTFFNERAGIESNHITKWFGNAVDQVLGWQTEKDKLVDLV